MRTHFLKLIIGALLISLITSYHYNITHLSVFTFVGFAFEVMLVVLFLTGVELGKTLNNKQLNEEEDGEE